MPRAVAAHGIIDSVSYAAPAGIAPAAPATPEEVPPPNCPWFLISLSAAALSLLLVLVRHGLDVPLFPSASRLPPAAPLFVGAGDCAPVNWTSAPAVEPELTLVSGVFLGDAPLTFSLAAPPTQASFVSTFMTTSAADGHGGMWAPVETLIFLYVLGNRPAPLVVDVGVNVGYFSALALALGATVVGFEPQARAHPYLVRTAAWSGAAARARWALFPCAIGPDRGHISMSTTEKWGFSQVDFIDGARAPAPNGPDFGGHDASRPQRTPMVRLNDVLSPKARVRLLKVDTEGFELEVFKGVGDELLRNLDTAVVEIKASAGRVAIMARFEAAGFSCRQYKEEYTDNTVVGLKGGFIDTRGMSRGALTARLAQHLLPCEAAGGGPEDFFFSRESFPGASS
jgi:FkbM family methyltransferase